VSLRRALPRWVASGASPWVIKSIQFGLKLPWLSRPTPYRARPLPLPVVWEAWALAKAESMVARGSLRKLTRAAARTAPWAANAFVTNLPDAPRLVINYRHVNPFLPKRPFRYESLAAFAMQLCKGDHLVLWDIAAAYHHLPLHPDVRPYLVFRVGGHFYEPQVLPFGLSLAPWAWTKLCRPVLAALRAAGFRALGYIDDFAAAPPGAAPATAAAATAGRRVAVRLFTDFGLQIAPHKGSAVGTTALPLLGYVVDTRRQLLLLPPVRLDRLRQAARHVLHHAAHHSRWVSASRLRRFCGLAVSTLLAVPLARYHLRSLYNALAGRGRRRDARLDAQGLRDLRWWSALASATGVGRALWDPTSAGEVTTDASPYGWGATYQRLVPTRGLFAPALADAHINLKELTAVRFAVQSYSHLFPPGAVLDVRTDSRVTMAVLNAICSRSFRLMAEVHLLHATLAGLGVQVRASWLPSLANVAADRLSRDADRTDWRLCPGVFSVLDAAWGPCTVDRFASVESAQLPRYNSRHLDPGCEAVDAWAQDWAGEGNFVNPPFSQAALLLRKLSSCPSDVVAVLPVWRAQPWWAEARGRADAVCFLPRAAVHYTHGRRRSPVPNPAWRTVAMRFVRGGTAWPPPVGAALCAPTSWRALVATLPPASPPTCTCRL